MPEFTADPRFYFDWDAEEALSPAGRGPSECGAGVFGLIQVGLASAPEALEAGRLVAATALAARSLPVTRGEPADTDGQAIESFHQLFAEAELVSSGVEPLIERARCAHSAVDPETALGVSREEVSGLPDAVRKLYASMGPSLRVPAPACAAPPVATPVAPVITADLTQELRGSVCPLNYVKTKMALERRHAGQVLAVLLDEQGARDVPESTAKDGHEALTVTPEEKHWRVVLHEGR